ncbi:MAG: fibronectin type III domain-containing protein [Trueperaceae bacterium]|nr:fibronectin type III domain-containing protein [Trueperaceae bacterium]
MLRFICLLMLIFLLTACPGPTPPTNLPPTAPKGLSVEAGDTEINLSWQANPETDIEAYLLRFQIITESEWQTKTIPALATETVITNLINDVTYHFSLQAKNRRGQVSEASKVVEGKPFKEMPKTFPPAQPQGLSATTGDALVMLTWKANTESDLAAYTLYWGESSDKLEQSKTLPKEATTTTVASLENGKAYFFALEALNTSGQASVRSPLISATPEAPLLAPRIDNVSIEDYGLSTQVRQGAGEITLVVTGANLSDLLAAALSGSELSLISKAETEAHLRASIGHGHKALGFQELTLVNAAGASSKAEVVEVTPITAMKVLEFKPSDSTGLGTPNRPFLTLNKALSLASGNDTIFLGNGTYKTDEVWPQENGQFPPKAAANVPSGITIKGQSGGGVILEGPGLDKPFAGLVFADGGTVKNLTLKGFRRGILLTNNLDAQLSLENVRILEGYTGLFAYNAAEVTIDNSEFFGQFDPQVNDGVGIYVIGPTTLTIRNTTSHANGDGLAIEGQAKAILSNLSLSDNEQMGLYNSGAYTILADSTVANNGQDGVYLNIKDGFLSREGFEMQGTTISGNKGYGLYLKGANAFVDLGTGTEPGNNSIFGNTDFQFFDNRSANSIPNVTLVGTLLGGFTLTGGLFTAGLGGKEFIDGGIKFWRINQQGNGLVFNP